MYSDLSTVHRSVVFARYRTQNEHQLKKEKNTYIYINKSTIEINTKKPDCFCLEQKIYKKVKNIKIAEFELTTLNE